MSCCARITQNCSSTDVRSRDGVGSPPENLLPDSKSRSAPFRIAWALTKPYFSSRGSWKAWLLVAAMVAAVVGRTGADVAMAN